MRRRTFVSSTGTVAVGAFAGCLGVLDGGGATGSTPDWVEWVPAGSVTDKLSRWDVAAIREKRPERVRRRLADDVEATPIDDQSSVDGMIQIEGNEKFHLVFRGQFDVDELRDELSGDQPPEEYRDFYVSESAVAATAIGESAVVVSSNPRAVIDTAAGDEPNLVEDDDEWELLLGEVREAHQVEFVQASGDGGSRSTDTGGGPAYPRPEKFALGVVAKSDERTEVTAQYLYESPDSARKALDEAGEERLADTFTEDRLDPEVKRVERDGRRIVVVVEQDWSAF